MLEKIKQEDRFLFKMGLSQENIVSVRFELINDFIKNSNVKQVIIFVDPIVLAKNSKLFELEYNNSNVIIIPTNIQEKTKNLETAIEIVKILEQHGVGRRDELICAVGGGALMDVVSFASSIFRRGIRVIKIPTTLLGIVDAAIGIKTGINFSGQRNRLGSYHFDFDVIIDPLLMNGNSKSLMRQGLGEIFKIAVIKGKNLFEELYENLNDLEKISFYNTHEGKQILYSAIQLMLEELHDNPRETNLKRCVDFGHSFCPLVEMQSLDQSEARTIPHGYAVAYDCLLTTIISHIRKKLNLHDYNKIKNLYLKFNFDFENALFQDNNLLWASFLELTKHRGFKQNLPIPVGIGEYEFVQDLTFHELKAANDFLKVEILG